MRLGQLARKIGVSTTEIINFLASKDIVIGEDSNAKIEDSHTRWIIQKYAPELLEIPAIIPEEKSELIAVEVPTPIEMVESIETQSIVDKQSITEIESLPEVIKAPKIELSGLKVLGKIEIPEKKKKENSLEEITIENTEDFERKTPSNRERSQRQYEKPSRKNPIALEREREEREAERRRKEQMLRSKEKKAQHYQSKVKVQVASKRIKMVEEPLEKIDTVIEVTPTTWWGKFKKWLRT